MTDRKAMQLALHALELEATNQPLPETAAAMSALRARLAEPEPEPVAWRYKLPSGKLWHFTPHGPHEISKRGLGMQPLYTTPPTRRPLTDDEISAAWAEVMLFPQRNKTHMDLARSFARAIEAAHGIKGTE